MTVTKQKKVSLQSVILFISPHMTIDPYIHTCSFYMLIKSIKAFLLFSSQLRTLIWIFPLSKINKEELLFQEICTITRCSKCSCVVGRFCLNKCSKSHYAERNFVCAFLFLFIVYGVCELSCWRASAATKRLPQGLWGDLTAQRKPQSSNDTPHGSIHTHT